MAFIALEPESVARQITGPFILLYGYSIKPTPNDLALYPYVSAYLSPHERSFFM